MRELAGFGLVLVGFGLVRPGFGLVRPGFGLVTEPAGPAEPADAPRGQRARRPFGRTVVSLLLWAVTAVLLVLGIAGIGQAVAGQGGAGSDSAVGFVFVVALFTGSGAWAVAQGGRRVGPAFDALLASLRGPQRRITGKLLWGQRGGGRDPGNAWPRK